MVTAFAQDSGNLALELHRLFGELDRSRFRWREHVRALPARLTRVQSSLRELVRRDDADAEAAQRVRARLLQLETELARHAPQSDLRSEWIAFRARVMPTYEELAATLRAASIHVPSLRPKNYARNAFHVLNAAVALVVLHLVPSWDVVIAIAWAGALAGWAMEISRRISPAANAFLMKLFGPVAHPHEAHRVNSATFYATSIALLATTRELIPCAVALVTLGLGDPIAAIVGRRWGRVRWVNGRSVEGTLAFVAAATIGGVMLLVGVHDAALGPALAIAGAAGLLGALAELYSRKIDDNLAIPGTAWAGAFLAVLAVS